MQQQPDKTENIRRYQQIAETAWKKARSHRVASLLLSGLSGFLAVFFVLMLIEHQSWLSPLLKGSLWFGAVAAGLLSAFGAYRSLPKPDYTRFRRSLTRETDLHELRYLLDLSKEQTRDPEVLRDAAIDQNLEKLHAIDSSDGPGVKARIGTWLSRSRASIFMKRVALATAVLLAVNLLYGMVHPHTAERSLAFFSTFEKPNPFTFTVSPGDTNVEQGGRFYVQVEFEGDTPESVSMALRTGVEERFRSISLEETTPGRFVSSPKELFQDSEYRIVMDEFSTRNYAVSVSQIPRFQELVARVVPPAYTGIESSRYTYPFSRLELPEGSTVRIEARANKMLSSADMEFSDGSRASLQPDEDDSTLYTKELTVSDPDTLRFFLEDEDGLTNRNRFSFNMRVIRDQHPTVRITRPEAVIQKLNPETLDLRVEARDDYGFSSMQLNYEIRQRFSPETKTGRLHISGRAPASANVNYSWDLTQLGLQSADELVYWVEVFDNDEINGFKSAVSERHVLRAASLAEHLLDQEEQEDSFERQLDELSRQQEESRRDLEQLRESIINNPDDTWEQERQTEEMIQQQEELSEQVQEMIQEFERMRQEMDDDQVISEETRQMYEELQQLMEEVDDPEIMEMLRKLQESIQNMDQDQIREALENLEFNERSYQERLERTVELFKQLRLNADMDRMSALLEELAKQEERVMELEDDPEAQAQQQQDIQDEIDKLKEKIEQLPEKSPQRRQQQVEQMMQEFSPGLDDVQQQLQDNIDELQSGSPDQQQSQQQQEQIRDQLRQMSEQMTQMRSSMQQEQININIAALKSIFQNMLTLSEAQEGQNKETLELEHNSPAFVMQARSQRNISSNFSQVVDSLFQVAREIPQFTNASLKHRLEVERTLDQSIDYLRERRKNQATTAERLSLGGLNQLTGMIADLIDQLDEQDEDGGGGGGMSPEQMMQQMDETGEMQQQLNQQIQDFINDVAGDRLSQDHIERLDQMARQQNEIRRQMQEMQRRGSLRPGDRLLSEMERIAEEMEDTINDLRGGQTDEILVERQQNILSRMLETQKAFDERGESEERRGETADEFERQETPEMTLEELEREIRNRLQDPDQTRFSEDYQQLIRLYFEILQELEGEEVLVP